MAPRANRRGAALVALALLGSASSFVGGFGVQRVQRGSPAVALRASEFEEAVAGSAVGDGGTTPLMMAAHQNDADEVEGFVKNGANIDDKDSYGWTALRYAVRAGNKDAASTLLKLGAKVDEPSASGRTPLMSAAANGISEMVELLLANGADVNAKNEKGVTALDLAKRGGSTACGKCREMLEKAR